MIRALMIRRIWLFRNNVISSLILSFVFLLTIFIFANLSFRNVLVISLYDIKFDTWIYPSMVLLVSGLSIIPSIFRDIFDLRIHKKVLTYLSLSPYSKRFIIFSFLVVALIEGIIMGLGSLLLFSFIIPYPFGLIETVALLVYSSIFILVFGNILITISILADKSATFLLSIVILFFFILLGSGLIIELPFFPSSVNYILSISPISMIVQAMQSYLFSGFINFSLTFFPILFTIVLLLINSILLRNKLRQ
ncbi:MAG: ABC transporter permease [Candidatus Neomarinimicrobiota bacterium]|nr:ABC transporter permease [Candidatus Neomarinimicrobiota bacterium]